MRSPGKDLVDLVREVMMEEKVKDPRGDFFQSALAFVQSKSPERFYNDWRVAAPEFHDAIDVLAKRAHPGIELHKEAISSICQSHGLADGCQRRKKFDKLADLLFRYRESRIRDFIEKKCAEDAPVREALLALAIRTKKIRPTP